MKNVWELNIGDKSIHNEGIMTFKGMDGMYGKWEIDGNTIIGHTNGYELGEDGIYIAIYN